MSFKTWVVTIANKCGLYVATDALDALEVTMNLVRVPDRLLNVRGSHDNGFRS